MTAQPYYTRDGVTLHLGDSLDILPTLPDASVDAIVTDPPYELGFMGRTWDASGIAYSVDLWRQCWRILKPGGHLAAFGGTRTYHRMAVAIEDAGFEIRDSLHWIYGSGMPKSLDVSKAIDKRREDRADIVRVTSWLADQADARGISRRDVDEHMGTSDMGGWWLSRLPHRAAVPTWEHWQRLRAFIGCGDEMDAEVWRLNGRKGTPGEAWGQREVIGVKKVIPGVAFTTTGPSELQVTAPASADAVRWQGWGTALRPSHEPVVLARKQISGTVAATVVAHGTGAINIEACRTAAHGGVRAGDSANTGRWPTNTLFTHLPLLDENGASIGDACADGCVPVGCPVAELERQASGVSRRFPVFRYQAKASSKERPRLPDGTAHNTVKPLALMQWLARLICPPGGTVLEPFAGSGTTLEACVLEGFQVIGVERHEPYAELCRVRLEKPMTAGLFGDVA